MDFGLSLSSSAFLEVIIFSPSISSPGVGRLLGLAPVDIIIFFDIYFVVSSTKISVEDRSFALPFISSILFF